MPAPSGFYFYDDPVAKTGGSLCEIDQTAGTFKVTGVFGPESIADMASVLEDALAEVIEQDLTDRTSDPSKGVHRPDGSVALTVSGTVPAAAPLELTAVKLNTASYSLTKGKDFRNGVRQFLLSLPPVA